MTIPTCEECGGSLNKNATRFCSHLCQGAWASRQASDVRAGRPEAVCDHCGVTFRPPHTGTRVRRTCSKACRYALVSATHRALGTKPPGTSPEDARMRITGANAPWWKGGRAMTSSGYVRVLAGADWPWPGMLDKQGRVREHRLVMAKHLGRALDSAEVVHHINGNRLDNRLENLELHESHSAHMREHHGRP